MTKGKRGRLEWALRAWAAMPEWRRKYVRSTLFYARQRHHVDDKKAFTAALALLRAAGVETRKERK